MIVNLSKLRQIHVESEQGNTRAKSCFLDQGVKMGKGEKRCDRT